MLKQLNTIISIIFISFLLISISYANDIKECESNADYKNGCIKRAYYKNNILWKETPYINKQENGIVKIYYKNGKIHFEIEYKEGKKEGIAKEYNENGEIIKEIIYKNGKAQ